MMNGGIGGDLFVIYWDAKSGKLTGLNCAPGPAPSRTERGLPYKAGVPVDARGNPMCSVTVPGAGRRLGEDA